MEAPACNDVRTIPVYLEQADGTIVPISLSDQLVINTVVVKTGRRYGWKFVGVHEGSFEDFPFGETVTLDFLGPPARTPGDMPYIALFENTDIRGKV